MEVNIFFDETECLKSNQKGDSHCTENFPFMLACNTAADDRCNQI